MSKVRTTPPDGQRWSSFLRQQAAGIWACDFVEVRDLWFRCHYVLVVIHLETRQILHAGSTLAPTAARTVQQLRDLTPFGAGPKFLLRDHDGRFSAAFDATAEAAGIRVIRTPMLAPKANAFVERCVGSIRRECLDHVIVLGEGHLQRLLSEYGPTSTPRDRTKGSASGGRPPSLPGLALRVHPRYRGRRFPRARRPSSQLPARRVTARTPRMRAVASTG